MEVSNSRELKLILWQLETKKDFKNHIFRFLFLINNLKGRSHYTGKTRRQTSKQMILEALEKYN